MRHGLKQAADWIGQAEVLFIGAGAGMGVDSGMPDFRGDQGFWKAYPAAARLGLSFSDLASPRWFRDDPRRAWGFYGHRLHLYRTTTPHRGFELLHRWAERSGSTPFVYTSNVDGHFQRAGFDQVVECHGSIHHLQCSVPCGDSLWSARGLELTVDEESLRCTSTLALCPDCGAVARPNILMFGDGGWDPQRTGDQYHRLQEWMGEAFGRRLVVIECGAGTAIPTVRSYCEQVARDLGGRLIRINPRQPEVPPGQLGLPLGALDALTGIEHLLETLLHGSG